MFEKGRVEPSESRFTYIGAMNWTYFNNNPDFVPIFEPNITASGIPEDDILLLCGESSACTYDYVVTGDQYFAANTLNQEDSLLRAMNASTPGMQSFALYCAVALLSIINLKCRPTKPSDKKYKYFVEPVIVMTCFPITGFSLAFN